MTTQTDQFLTRYWTCEARMRSAKPFIDSRISQILIRRCAVGLATASIVLVGCRTNRPLGSMVQVTEDPAAVFADVPAPKQRLATATTGKQADADTQTKSAAPATTAAAGLMGTLKQSHSSQVRQTAAVGMPEVFREESQQTSAEPSAPAKPSAATASTAKTTATETTTQTVARPRSSGISTSLSDLKPVVVDDPDPADLESDAITGSLDPSSKQTVGSLVSASLTDLSSADGAPTAPSHLAATTDVVATADPSDQGRSTAQPHALTAALQQSLATLPALPDTQTDPNGPAPTRIGSKSDSDHLSHVGDLDDTQPSVAMNADLVRPVSHDTDPAPENVDGLKADPPAPELSNDALYAQLIERLVRPVDGETPVEKERRQITARHLMVLAGDPNAATQQIDGLNETEQRYLKNQLLGLWTIVDPEGHPSSSRRITEALPMFREATRHMAAATDSLALNHLEFCTEIEDYGQIKPFAGNRFIAGQQVILYCEVENFAAAPKDDQFETQLRGSYDIYDDAGTKVIGQLLPVDQQRSRNRLRDYFVAYKMNLPKQLPQGTYRLELTLEDVVGKKYGQSNIPFEIKP
ncbi:hypothetical protein [Stieleria tagensis]|uniref:hypothetical protein n=1 Tax=Stieleria tagensis TaxID=2956795 RepID=UPI00209A8B0A|nr:hypothetical protein [Stieleria tagensis]